MKDKKQDVNSLEELVKTADSYRAFFANLADELSKVLADIKAPEKEEDTWEMKCPYEEGDKVFKLGDDGLSWECGWDCMGTDESRFEQGNIFPTRQAALLESKRRKLLTRFKAFRDECNDGWKPDWDINDYKYFLYFSADYEKIYVGANIHCYMFNLLGYFKNKADALRAIELFGDEIKRLYVEVE